MTPDDMARLHAAAFRTERPWTADEFATLAAHPRTQTSTTPHGFALWRAIAGEAELLTIATDPRHQRTGIATRLMTDWMAQAAASCETAFLEVAADNVAACALYDRFGFATVATRTGYYRRADGKADALVMRATLPRIVTGPGR